MRPSDLLGRSVANRWLVERLAGEGGMGAVYRATDRDTGLPVAIKVMHDAHGDALDRFDREASVLAALNHPCIVRHVKHGRTDDGAPFLVMEWIEGEDLAQRLARQPLLVAESVTLIARIADALNNVHSQGIVHRDVKPSNVFLRDGTPEHPVLLDFGIARRRDAATALTRTGNVLGTPQYMAPEQVRGDRDVGPAADIFALGCVFYECLAHRPAFLGEHAMAVLAKILLEDPPRVIDLVRDLSPSVDQLVRSMLSKRPNERPASAGEVAKRLSGDVAVTLAPSGKPAASVLTGRERRLISVVIARDAAEESDRTVTPAELSSQRAVLHRRIESLGGTIVPIGSEHVVVTVPALGVAIDQATTAARCARAVADGLPQATVALAMGWGEIDPVPVGEVIDRAATMLTRTDARIPVDDISAGLLELRFELTGDPGHRALGTERTSTEPPRTLLGRPTPCVGRDRELSVLLGLMSEVVSDHVARVALVTASAGVGKSRLRHELCTRIAHEHAETVILVARGEPFRANASLDMLGQILRDAAGIRESDDLAQARSKLLARTAHVPRDPTDVAAFLGEIASVPVGEGVSARLAAAKRDNRLVGELMIGAWTAWLEAETNTHPVLLILEDLHWADPQTVRYVDIALRDLASQRLMVLALARPEVRTRFPALWKERSAQEVALPALTPRASERLVRGVLSDLSAPEVERIVHQCEGNALYLEEMIRAAATGRIERTPGSVLAMMQSRLESLDPEERRVMRAASVFGESFRVDDVAALTDANVGRTLEALTQREVMIRRRADDSELAFRHALVREAAYAMLTPEDRTRAHLLAAERLESRGTTDAVVVAEHYDLGKDRERAAKCWADAARQAILKTDFDAAIVHAEAALQRTETSSIRAAALAARGKARACQGQWIAARTDLEESLELAPNMDPARRIEHLADLWLVGIFRQDAPLLRRAGTEAGALAEKIGRADLVVSARAALATADFADGACAKAVALFREAVGTGTRPTPLVGLASIMLYHVGAFAECEAITRKMIETAADLGDASSQVILEANLGLSLASMGNYEDALGAFGRSRALAIKFGLTTLHARALSTSTGYRIDVFDFAEAERLANETIEVGRVLEFATPRVSAGVDLACSAVRQGQVERALATLDEVREEVLVGKGFHGWIWRSRVSVLYAELLAVQGNWQDALRLASACIPGCAAVMRVKYRLLAEHVCARALSALGRRDEAIAVAHASLEEARTYPDPTMVLRAAATLLEIDADTRARDDLVASASRIEKSLVDERSRIAFRSGAPLGHAG